MLYPDINIYHFYIWSLKGKRKDEIAVNAKEEAKEFEQKMFFFVLLEKTPPDYVLEKNYNVIIIKEF